MNVREFDMQPLRPVHACLTFFGPVAALGIAVSALADGNGPNMFGFADPTGIVRTYNANGSIDFDNPFFQSLGTNGRSCASCHQPADGWTIVPLHIQARFDATDGEDPIFRSNDGSKLANVRRIDPRRQARGRSVRSSNRRTYRLTGRIEFAILTPVVHSRVYSPSRSKWAWITS
jgi:hypothetical protein